VGDNAHHKFILTSNRITKKYFLPMGGFAQLSGDPFLCLQRSVQENPHHSSQLHPNPGRGTGVAISRDQWIERPLNPALK
jgi:hypothetical protein